MDSNHSRRVVVVPGPCPAADGGSGMDKVSDCIVREELSYMSFDSPST